MILFPCAKINLGLSILEKRKDGFHSIETVFYPIGLSDILEINIYDDRQFGKIEFSQSGILIPGDKEGNLCIKAYQLLSKKYHLKSISAHLHKRIPIGAGLGGGSSDAASFLISLNEFLKIGLSETELFHYAGELGSDCPFFIMNSPAFATGRGEVLSSVSIDLSGKYLVLVKPEIHISTKEAYAGVRPRILEESVKDIVSNDLSSWKERLHNQFEDTLFEVHPQIAYIKSRLYEMGAIYASMSGSGSTVFGLFTDEIDLGHQFKNSFVWQEQLK